MTISKDLLLAISSMDAYNRGYGAGISDGKSDKDAEGNDIDGLGEAGSVIGNATVLDFDLPANSVAAGFYAIAYDTDFGTVISYRGTDSASDLWDSFEFEELGELILTDIPIARNDDFDEPSVHFASQFYESVLVANDNRLVIGRLTA